jgi:rhodanese-related sulfurtransferase
MTKLFGKGLVAVICVSFVWAVASQAYAVPKIPVITKEDLNKMLDVPGVTVIDVRVERDWTSADRKIKGAVREDPDRVDTWAGKYSKDKTIVLYCS